MTRTVTRGGRLAAWLAVGAMLAAAGQAWAEPLVSRLGPGGPPGRSADFAVAPARPAPAVARQAPRRGPRTSKLQELREQFLREHGVGTTTLFFGYYGGFLPPTSIPVADAPPAAVPGTPGPVISPSFSMPPPPPVQGMPTSLPAYAPPPQSMPPSQAPEPATLLTGLLGAGLAGLATWRKRRRQGARAA
jgi:hypothetical protein